MFTGEQNRPIRLCGYFSLSPINAAAAAVCVFMLLLGKQM